MVFLLKTFGSDVFENFIFKEAFLWRPIVIEASRQKAGGRTWSRSGGHAAEPAWPQSGEAEQWGGGGDRTAASEVVLPDEGLNLFDEKLGGLLRLGKCLVLKLAEKN
jgi:hypothetical protein